MLRMRGIVWRIGRRRVLDGIDLDVKRGTLCAVRGDNGAGKTTLLQIAAGVLEPHAGSVVIEGFDIADRRARARLGYAPAAATMAEHLAVREWIDLIAALRGVRDSDIARSTGIWQVDGFLGARLGTLSLGERRRLVLATAELGEPDLLLLDEPSVGLDPGAQRLLVERLRARAAAGKAALVASHDADLISRLDGEVRLLAHGRIASEAVVAPPLGPA